MISKQIRTNAIRLLVPHVAVRLGVAQSTVRRWARHGALKGHRISVKVWEFLPADVDDFERRRAYGKAA